MNLVFIKGRNPVIDIFFYLKEIQHFAKNTYSIQKTGTTLSTNIDIAYFYTNK